MTPDVALLVLRLFAGLTLAGHGAQHVFGAWGGPGLENWSNNLARMGLPAAALLGAVHGYAELLGGLALALGLLTPIAAALLAVPMIVATWRVHSKNGFWIMKGGYEYSLTHLVIFVVLGVTGPGAYALDSPLGLGAYAAPTFLIAGGVGIMATAAATQQPAFPEEERRRRVA